MYTRICSSVLFPLHERLKGHRSVSLRKELERSQWQDAVQIEQEQVRRLGEFLSKAGSDVPYYRRAFADAGFRPEQLLSVHDLGAIPFLTKELIRANTDSIKSSKAGRMLRYNTGGSSGEPLVFYMGMDRVSHDVAAKWRATRWWGVDIGDPEAVLWGSPIEIGKQDRVKAARDRLFRSHLLPAFEMSDLHMDRYLDRLRRLKPKMVFGYASALALLARHAEGRGRRLDGLGTKVVFTTGETLYPDQRDVIQRVFGAPVANGYGSRDAGFIAHECPHGSLHLSAEHIVVELIDSAGRPVPHGERGEVVTTHLSSGDFPFVRYRTGDVAVRASGPCACGRGLPVFAQVFGRETDFIRTATGNVLHALALIYEVRDKPGIRAFKFVQQPDLALELMIVAAPECDAGVEASIRAGVLARMGRGTALTIRRVESIPAERSGKHRYVVSHAMANAAVARNQVEGS